MVEICSLTDGDLGTVSALVILGLVVFSQSALLDFVFESSASLRSLLLVQCAFF